MCCVLCRISSKVIDPNEVEDMREVAAVTLCMLEATICLAFFKVMEHLVYEEIQSLAVFGPVNVRWMYCVEHMNKVLKGYVQNLARPEACMVEDYVMGESVSYVT